MATQDISPVVRRVFDRICALYPMGGERPGSSTIHLAVIEACVHEIGGWDDVFESPCRKHDPEHTCIPCGVVTLAEDITRLLRSRNPVDTADVHPDVVSAVAEELRRRRLEHEANTQNN